MPTAMWGWASRQPRNSWGESIRMPSARHLGPPGVDEHGPVLGGGDVPFQALKEQQVTDRVTGGDDVRVHLSTPIFACWTLPWSVMTIQSRPYAWAWRAWSATR